MHFAIDRQLHFDYICDISGTTYPIKSNKVISQSLAKQKNAVYININVNPARPSLPEMWNHYAGNPNLNPNLG